MNYFERRGSMKKVLVLLTAAVALTACSKNTKDDNKVTTVNKNGTTVGLASVNSKDAKYQIIDQEFDNLLAADSDYDTVCAYELQACGDAYLPPAGKLQSLAEVKAAAKKADISKDVNTKSTNAKKVVNTTNIYYVDGPNPNVPVSSKTTTTTTYKDGKSTTTTTTSGAAATSSSTTTSY